MCLYGATATARPNGSGGGDLSDTQTLTPSPQDIGGQGEAWKLQ